jgi:hypothetical protein
MQKSIGMCLDCAGGSTTEKVTYVPALTTDHIKDTISDWNKFIHTDTEIPPLARCYDQLPI